MDKCWNKYAVSLVSFMTTVMCLPILFDIISITIITVIEDKPQSKWHWRNKIPGITIFYVASNTRQISVHVASPNSIDIFVQLNQAKPRHSNR